VSRDESGFKSNENAKGQERKDYAKSYWGLEV